MKITTYNDHRSAPFPEPWSFNSNQVYSVEGADAVISSALTNAFSKKVENHAHAIALHFKHYNFCRIRQTLRVTPTMEAGISDHVWSIEEIVDLLDAGKVEDAA
jgi:hypothetical protein